MIAVVPVTGTPGDGALYPSLALGPSGLTKASYVLTDHVRSIDKRRIRRTYGQVSAAVSGRFPSSSRLGNARGAIRQPELLLRVRIPVLDDRDRRGGAIEHRVKASFINKDIKWHRACTMLPRTWTAWSR